jgi:hypothetical protein
MQPASASESNSNASILFFVMLVSFARSARPGTDRSRVAGMIEIASAKVALQRPVPQPRKLPRSGIQLIYRLAAVVEIE